MARIVLWRLTNLVWCENYARHLTASFPDPRGDVSSTSRTRQRVKNAFPCYRARSQMIEQLPLGVRRIANPLFASRSRTRLAQALCSTNPCESMIEVVRHTERNVKRRQTATCASAGQAAGMLVAEQFRRDHRIPQPRHPRHRDRASPTARRCQDAQPPGGHRTRYRQPGAVVGVPPDPEIPLPRRVTPLCLTCLHAAGDVLSASRIPWCVSTPIELRKADLVATLRRHSLAIAGQQR
ncbi:MAG: hypothetical protein QOH16_699 [Gaiellaceae bacterium]|nr:hypothetical protein [Gaiellaceae bacterium]